MPEIERTQTQALERVATGIGQKLICSDINSEELCSLALLKIDSMLKCNYEVHVTLERQES